jgi:hypothetical protein
VLTDVQVVQPQQVHVGLVDGETRHAPRMTSITIVVDREGRHVPVGGTAQESKGHAGPRPA